MNSSIKVLDLGCGQNKIPGSVGIDFIQLPSVDIVHDLNVFPYPIADSSFDKVFLRNIIEHVTGIMKTMEEVHRISKPDALVEILTPHYSSYTSWTDPTHLWHLGSQSFDYFCLEQNMNYYSQARFHIEYSHIKLNSVYKWLGFEFLVNLQNQHKGFNFIRKFWERYLCFIIRARFMTFHLRVIKSSTNKVLAYN